MRKDYPFSRGGNPIAIGHITTFPLLDPKVGQTEQALADQMADQNSLLAFPDLHEGQRELNEAVQAASMLARTFDETLKDERNEVTDFGIFGRVLLVALALVELTITFANETDMAEHVALVAEIKNRLSRLLGQIGLVDEALAILAAQTEQRVEQLLDEPLIAHPTEKRYRSLAELDDHLRALDTEVKKLITLHNCG